MNEKSATIDKIVKELTELGSKNPVLYHKKYNELLYAKTQEKINEILDQDFINRNEGDLSGDEKVKILKGFLDCFKVLSEIVEFAAPAEEPYPKVLSSEAKTASDM